MQTFSKSVLSRRFSQFAVDRFRSLKRIIAVALILLVAGVILDQPGDVAYSAGARVTICHRTRSTSNPYRLITVSNNAVNTAGHGRTSHTGIVWNNTLANGGTWGDIIPGSDDDGDKFWSDGSGVGTGDNWTADGKSFMLSGGANLSKCTRMTAKAFYDLSVAAGVSVADIAADLNEQEANEDAAVKPAGGWTVDNVTTAVVNSGSATTNAATASTQLLRRSMDQLARYQLQPRPNLNTARLQIS